jgi:dienelactone hydrolase
VKQTELSFWSDGIELVGVLYEPDDPATSTSGVVVCHSHFQPKEGLDARLAAPLVAAGAAVLSFDYRDTPALNEPGQVRNMMEMDRVRDVRHALSCLSDRMVVKGVPLGLLGTSAGASTAIYAAALDKRVASTVALWPYGNGERWLRYARRLAEWEQLRALIAEDWDRRASGGEGHAIPAIADKPGGLGIAFWELPEEAARWATQVKALPKADCLVPLAAVESCIEFSPEDVIAKIAPRSVLLVAQTKSLAVPYWEEAHSLFQKAARPKGLAMVDVKSPWELFDSPTLLDDVVNASAAWFARSDFFPSDRVDDTLLRKFLVD